MYMVGVVDVSGGSFSGPVAVKAGSNTIVGKPKTSATIW
jgi:hypothetical protein